MGGGGGTKHPTLVTKAIIYETCLIYQGGCHFTRHILQSKFAYFGPLYYFQAIIFPNLFIGMGGGGGGHDSLTLTIGEMRREVLNGKLTAILVERKNRTIVIALDSALIPRMLLLKV